MNNKELTADLDYKAEYYRLKEEFEKMCEERNFLDGELKACDKKLNWYHGFNTAIELIFRKQNSYD